MRHDQRKSWLRCLAEAAWAMVMALVTPRAFDGDGKEIE